MNNGTMPDPGDFEPRRGARIDPAGHRERQEPGSGRRRRPGDNARFAVLTARSVLAKIAPVREGKSRIFKHRQRSRSRAADSLVVIFFTY